jgi:hypothetical protein
MIYNPDEIYGEFYCTVCETVGDDLTEEWVEDDYGRMFLQGAGRCHKCEEIRDFDFLED